MHHENWNAFAFVSDRLLNLFSETPVLPLRTAKASNNQITKLLYDTGTNDTSTLFNRSYAFLSWRKDEFASQTKPGTNKLHARDIIKGKLSNVSRRG